MSKLRPEAQFLDNHATLLDYNIASGSDLAVIFSVDPGTPTAAEEATAGLMKLGYALDVGCKCGTSRPKPPFPVAAWGAPRLTSVWWLRGPPGRWAVARIVAR